MILKILLNTQMIWMIFIKILKKIIRIKKYKIVMVFDDMVADMLSDKRLNPIVTELFFKGRKLKIPLVFITHSYFPVQKKY